MMDKKKKRKVRGINSRTSKRNKLPEENWYAKLHPIGHNNLPNHSAKNGLRQSKRKRILNLSLFFRIWIAVGIIIIISGIVVFNQLFNYVRPTTQQVIEDTLVDTAKLLSASLQTALETREIYKPSYQQKLDAAFIVPDTPAQPYPSNSYVNKHQLDTLSTWYTHKTHSSFRVYVTDAEGIVIYDSLADATGIFSNESAVNENLEIEGFDFVDSSTKQLANNNANQSDLTVADLEDVKSSQDIESPILDSDIFNDDIEALSDNQIYGYTNAEGQDYSSWRDVYLT